MPTGIKVAQAAAANVVPSVTELGGKSPFVVFADADSGFPKTACGEHVPTPVNR